MCVRACVRACVHACVRVCLCACVPAFARALLAYVRRISYLARENHSNAASIKWP